MTNRDGSTHIPAWRLRATYLILLGAVVVFILRLYQLQVVESATFLDQADENRFSNVSVPAPRGVIYDRNGFQLVRNIPAYNIVITPAGLPDSEAEVQAIYLGTGSVYAKAAP